ncbi:MAG: cell division protein FtsQ/DivIB [Schleiferilactobacillus perolens]|jgi:cell division protein FtsQ|uniref:Cell division protein DivIB n=1 Tax=Schleiferilactobacillus perolens DSM 12744 TaxID=1423792 RepID=A0A0R1N8M8_9LACO|nr:cell division protein FtsQ/DivIB [Schleiferilactobacillus perolens]KRL14213.1 cell division FtsQ family protein [Schleiferilactobacillus perolens DSM 12744]
MRRKQKGEKPKSRVDPQRTIQPWEHYLAKQENANSAKPSQELHVSKTLPQWNRQRTRRLVKNTTIVLLVFLVVGLVTAYFLTPFSRVREISVQGTNVAADQAVIDESHIRSGESLMHIFLHRHTMTRDLKKRMPILQSAQIVPNGINDITLRVKEYPVVGYTVKQGIYYPVLSTGTVLKDGQSKPVGNSPIYADFTSAKHLAFAVKVYTSLSQHVQADISEVHDTSDQRNPNRVMLYMNDQNKVIADLTTLKQKIIYYPKMKTQLKGTGIVDLEVGAYAIPNKSENSAKNP